MTLHLSFRTSRPQQRLSKKKEMAVNPVLRGLCPEHDEDDIYQPYQSHTAVSHWCQHLSLKPSDVEAVVSHSPCPDGFISLVIAYYALDDQAEYYPVSHDKMDKLIDQLKDKKVLFVDIAPSPALLASLTSDYAILDHHSNTEKLLSAVPKDKKWFHMPFSGCHQAWEYFFPGRDFPLLFQAIEARDLWNKDLVQECDELLQGAHTELGWCPCCWWENAENLAYCELLRDKGRLLMKEHRQQVQKYVRTAAPREKDGHRIWIMNINDSSCISEAGNEVLKVAEDRNKDVSLSFRYDVKNQVWAVSLRSLEEGPNVGQLARQWADGGGHDHAAGLTWKQGSIESLFAKEEEEPQTKKRKAPNSPLCSLL